MIAHSARCSSSNEARRSGERALDTSLQAVAESETIILANDYGFDLPDVVDLDHVDADVELENSSRSKPPLIPRMLPQQSDLHPFSLK